MTASTDKNARCCNRPTVAALTACMILLAFTTTGCGGTQSQWIGKFDRAQEELSKAQTQAQYEDVARRYEELLDEGARCGAVYFNLGNAYMKADQPGRAVAAYRQAQRYWPAHQFLEHNLKTSLGENGQAEASKPLIENLLFWQNWISYLGKFKLAASIVLITFALGIGALFAKEGSKIYFRRAAITGIVFSSLFILSAAYDWYRFDHQQQGVVVAPEVIVRKGYSKESKPAFTKPLAEGTEFQVRQTRNDWLLIELPDAQKGWIPATSAQTY